MDETNNEKIVTIEKLPESGKRILKIHGMAEPLEVGGFINVDISKHIFYGWIQSIETNGCFLLHLQSDKDPTELDLDMAMLSSGMYTFRGQVVRSWAEQSGRFMLLKVISGAMRIQQRKYFRLAVKLEVHLYIPGSRIDTVTHDIGIGGMSVLLPRKLEPGEFFMAQINFKKGKRIEVMVRVVRAIELKNTWRICMCFEQVNYELDQFLARNLFRLEVNGDGTVQPTH